jgi:hypothetical protein
MAIGIESGQLWLKGAAIQLEHYHLIFAGDPAINHPQAFAIAAYTNMVRDRADLYGSDPTHRKIGWHAGIIAATIDLLRKSDGTASR